SRGMAEGAFPIERTFDALAAERDRGERRIEEASPAVTQAYGRPAMLQPLPGVGAGRRPPHLLPAMNVIRVTAAPAPARRYSVRRTTWIPKSRVERVRGGPPTSEPGARGGNGVRLVLSTAAATGFTVDELLAACRRRGLAGIELVAGHAHGVGAGLDATALGAIRRRLESGGAPVAAFRTTLAEAFHP